MAERRINIFRVFKNEGQITKVLCYPSYETVTDRFEQTKSETFLNPITARAIVTPMSAEAIRWKYYGKIPTGSVKIVAEKRYETIIKTSGKIKIGNNYYKCLFDDEKGFAIKSYSDYFVAVLEMKTLNA